MSLMQKIRKNSGKILKPLAPVIAGVVMSSCSPQRTEIFESGEPCSSSGIVHEKHFLPDAGFTSYGLRAFNSKGEDVTDGDYIVNLTNIPEIPNTLYGINSPRLFNSVAEGDTVDLTLQDHLYLVLDSDGDTLSQRNHTDITDYSPRHPK